LTFLVIEFFDELQYGLQSAALPVIRSDLALTYAQVGILLGLPKITGTLIEPLLLLLGDTAWRKRLVVSGGLVVALTLLLIAGASNFLLLLLAFIIGFPASGAFVSLSQATLMDLNPGRTPQMMARWTAYGSLGGLAGPAILAAGLAIGIGWRVYYLSMALIAIGLVLILLGRRFPPHQLSIEWQTLQASLTWTGLLRWTGENLVRALKVKALQRWILLLEFSDLLLDVFTSYAALYFADVAGLSPAQTGLAMTLLMLASLVADLVAVPLLERFPGRSLVRLTALLSIPIYTLFLLAPSSLAKVILAVAIRFSTMGWYAVLQGEAYASVPERSGTVAAINSLAGLLGGAMIYLIGQVAEGYGLASAMWLLLLAPLVLVLFTPPAKKSFTQRF
jgi:FSR family fosmidomycin resistance protein-like MFS transporter